MLQPVLPPRVLIVDDERAIRSLLRLHLEGSHSVDEAGGGNEALVMLGLRQYDLLIVDLVMPDMTGTDVIRVVHSLWPAVKVVAMSGLTVERMLPAAAGFVPLQKPFGRGAIVAAVETALGAEVNQGSPSR